MRHALSAATFVVAWLVAGCDSGPPDTIQDSGGLASITADLPADGLEPDARCVEASPWIVDDSAQVAGADLGPAELVSNCAAHGESRTLRFEPPVTGRYDVAVDSPEHAVAVSILDSCDATASCEDGPASVQLEAGQAVIIALHLLEEPDSGIDPWASVQVRLSSPPTPLGEAQDDVAPEGLPEEPDTRWAEEPVQPGESALPDDPVAEICGDGLDNDGDCLTDCADVDCHDSAACDVEREPGLTVPSLPSQLRVPLLGASDTHDLSCSSGVSDRAVRFVADEAGAYVFDSVGSATPTAIGILDPDSLDELACSSSGAGEDGSAAHVVAMLEADQEVWVVLDALDVDPDTAACAVAAPDLHGDIDAVLHVSPLLEREAECDEWRDLDDDGLMSCLDPDCAEDVRCAQASVRDLTSADPSCAVDAECAATWSAVAQRADHAALATIAKAPSWGSSGDGAGATSQPTGEASSPPTSASMLASLTWTSDNTPYGPPPTIGPSGPGWGGPTTPGGEPRYPVMADSGLQYGRFSDVVEIELPPGPNGTAPSLSLTHDHLAGDSGAGKGFRLQTLAPLIRQSETGGPPNQTKEERYVLGGQVLVATARGYEPERRDGRVATHDTTTNTWTVVHPDGRTTTYGSVSGVSENATVPLYTEYGRVLQNLDNSGQPATAWFPDEAAYHPDYSTCGFSTIQIKRCNTAMWLPSVQEDPYGNQVVYDYGIAPAPTNAPAQADYWYEDGRSRRLSEIRYGPSERERVVFGYEPHPFPTVSMSKGLPEFLTERLTTIDILSDGSSIGGYRLSYRNEGGGSYLETVDRTTPGLGSTALQIRHYDYSFEDPTWQTPIDVTNAFAPAAWTRGWDRVIATPMNLNGDGRADLLWSRVDCSSGAGGLNCSVDHDAKVLSEGFGAGGFSLGAGFVDDPLADYIEGQLATRITDDEFELDRAWFFADFDGDGYQELVHEKEDPVTGDLLAFVSRFDPYQKAYLDAPFPLTDIDELTPADVNGDGCVDLIRDSDTIRTGDEEWYRSTCRDPWIDGTPMALDTTRAGIDDAEDETGESLTPPQHTDAAGLVYKFAEVNGDGMVDLV
nr:hypothetical protein [Myxococcales bacterium]